MEYELIKQGRVRLGNGPYEVRDVTKNAVVILRPIPTARKSASEAGVAVMNIPVTNPPSVDDAVDETVDKYLSRTGEQLRDIEAVLIGGMFQENMVMDDGTLVSRVHDLVANCVIESLVDRGVRLTPMETELLSTKTVKVESNGDIVFEEKYDGLNKYKAQMSRDEYFARKGHNRCCD